MVFFFVNLQYLNCIKSLIKFYRKKYKLNKVKFLTIIFITTNVKIIVMQNHKKPKEPQR